MNRDELRSLQLTQLEILKKIKTICDKHSINYFLSDGTLLGAVRHKGFIPWDDDLDIGMLRSDYEKFIKIAQVELGNMYFLQTWETDKKYPFPYAKILKNGTVCTEEITENTGVRTGVFVDVFPFDKCDDWKSINLDVALYIIWNKLLQMKSKYKVWKASKNRFGILPYVPFIFLGFILPRNYIIKNIEEITKKWNRKHSESCFHFENAGNNITKWIVCSDFIENYTEMVFEDDTFKGPKDYDGYLKSCYGDYMKLPPLDERENRHSVIELKL